MKVVAVAVVDRLRDAIMARLAESHVQIKQNQEEFKRELRQIALSVAKTKKKVAMDDEARGEHAFPMDG